jgi:tocopherol cyclase
MLTTRCSSHLDYHKAIIKDKVGQQQQLTVRMHQSTQKNYDDKVDAVASRGYTLSHDSSIDNNGYNIDNNNNNNNKFNNSNNNTTTTISTTTITTTTSTITHASTIQSPRTNHGYPRVSIQTPHAERHFTPSHPAYKQSLLSRIIKGKHRRRKRFMEGWYYRLTLPEQKASFAIIISTEDTGNARSDLRLVCMQIIGPKDGYLVQTDRDDTKFWASKNEQALGHVFAYTAAARKVHESEQALRQRTVLSTDEWYDSVDSGFQILPHHFVGKIRGVDGHHESAIQGQGAMGMCDFDFAVDHLCGWGDALSVDTDVGGSSSSRGALKDGESETVKVTSKQKSTGGWLASYAVFEPHWQVTMADGRATGRITWQGQVYDFVDAPFYAEKNWGAALPSKWYWTQCNAFDGYYNDLPSDQRLGSSSSAPSSSPSSSSRSSGVPKQLSVTAGGGVRSLPFGRKESLGMVCVHYNGIFYEAVPWSGYMEWEVTTWGSWIMRGNSTFCDHPFEVEVVYKCDPSDDPGLVFRAPTPDQGMVFFCRDTFDANVTLTLWELEWDASSGSYCRKPGAPLIDGATSTMGGAEVGGGPWWSTWKQSSVVKQPFLTLLRIPVRVQRLMKRKKRRQTRGSE